MATRGTSPTRYSRRERVQTSKAAAASNNVLDLSSSDTENAIEVGEEPVPAAPRPKRTVVSAHLKERVMATRGKAVSAKHNERPTIAATSSSQGAVTQSSTNTAGQV